MGMWLVRRDRARRRARARALRPAAGRPARAPLPHRARQDGVLVWDTFWYAGHYPFLSLQPPLLLPRGAGRQRRRRARLGGRGRGALRLARRAGSGARPPAWPSRVFAVVACGPLFTGTYPYAAGLAAALGALKALQLGGRGRPSRLAALTLGLSPLAFFFLCLVVARARSSRGGRGSTATVLAGAGLAARARPRPGSAPPRLPGGGGVPVLPRLEELAGRRRALRACAALALRGGERGASLGRCLRALGAGGDVAFVVPSPIGENVTRPARHRAPARAARGRARLVPAAVARGHRVSGRLPSRSFPTSARRSTGRTRAPRRHASGSPRSTSWRSAGARLAR